MVIVEVNKIPTKEAVTDVPLDDPVKVYNTCLELRELCEQEHGIGISAVQVGLPWKLFLVKGDGSCPLIPQGEYGYFVNCDYKAATEERVVSLEGCLSLRSEDGRLRSFQVERFQKIHLFGYRLLIDSTLRFERVDCELDCFEEGIVFQHEIDHQQGQEGLLTVLGTEVLIW